MATLKTYGRIVRASAKARRLHGTTYDRATNGAPSGRSLFSADHWRFEFVLGALDATQLAEFRAFYTTNRDTYTTSLYWPPLATTYNNLEFIGEPEEISVSEQHTDVRIVLEN